MHNAGETEEYDLTCLAFLSRRYCGACPDNPSGPVSKSFGDKSLFLRHPSFFADDTWVSGGYYGGEGVMENDGTGDADLPGPQEARRK